LEGFKKEVKNWLAQINMHLLIDTLVVGGGREESLETLAEFAESSTTLEKERKAMLTPLLIVPFIGAVLLIVTVMMFMQFFSSMSAMSQPLMPILTLTRMMLTPLIIHDFLLGLVSGKIVSGKVSSGFKMATYLVIISLAGIYLSSRVIVFTPFGSG
jgi:flagellar protein FlaJ